MSSDGKSGNVHIHPVPWTRINLYFQFLETVIKRRLLIDGDGTGDDRRLNVLMRSFIKWSNTNDTPENT